MKWFRSNVRHGSRLALLALAIQLMLSFGHFHERGTPASASQQAQRSGQHLTVVAAQPASPSNASAPIRSKGTDHGRGGQPTDDCAICAVMALANAVVAATPPYLLVPQAESFFFSVADAGFVDPNRARVAFQPRAPPIA